jgi:TonB family protein
MIEDWPEISQGTVGAVRRKKVSGAAFVSLALSIGIHAMGLVVLVRMGVLRSWVTISFQGGGNGADVGTGSPGGEPMTAPMTGPQAAQLPHLGPAAFPAEVQLPAVERADSTAMVVPPAHRSVVELLDDSTPQLIGVPVGGGEEGLRFSHWLPERLANLPSGSAVNGAGSPSDRADGVAGGAPYLLNQEGGAGVRANGGAGGKGAVPGGAGDGGGGSGFAPSARNRKPTYPPDAMRLGYEGKVRLAVEIKEDGSVGAVSVDKTSGFDMLDEAAIEGVRRWHFTWDKSCGSPQRTQVFVPIEFIRRDK